MVYQRFRRPKGITSAPKTPNMQHLTHLPSYSLRALNSPHRILKTEFLTHFAELVNIGQHSLTSVELMMLLKCLKIMILGQIGLFQTLIVDQKGQQDSVD